MPATDYFSSQLRVNGALGFWEIAKAEPRRLALITADHARVTFGDLADRANRIARMFSSLGLKQGDGVAVALANEPDFLAIQLAVLQRGMYLTPLNWHLTASEIPYILRDSDARLLIASARFARAVSIAADEADLPADCRIGAPGFDGFRDLDSLLAEQSPEPPGDRFAGALMMYTSGTTGRPKGVRRPLSPHPPEKALETSLLREARAFDLVAGDGIHLLAAPLYHAAPNGRAIAALHLGHAVVMMEKWTAACALKLIERYAVTSTFMVPTMFHRMLQLPAPVRDAYQVGSLKHVLHAGAPCPIATKCRMMAWLGPVVYEFYASTEGAGTSVKPHDWLERPGTVGRPSLPDGDLKIRDEQGNEMAPGDVGMIFIRASAPFEYYKNPAATAHVLQADGYFTAGDYGYLDKDGWLYIADRRTDLIISGGMNIYPAEVEARLLEHPCVGDAVVIGLPSEEWGEEVLALVEPVDDVAPDSELAKALLRWCRTGLAAYKCPRRIGFRELPRTATGKLSRRRVKDAYLVESLNAPKLRSSPQVCAT